MAYNFDPIIRKAELAAAQVLGMFGITDSSEIRLRDIAYDLGATVIEGELSGAAASLTVLGGKAIIRIDSDDIYSYRKRFSIGHELGHFVLKHGIQIKRICDDSDFLKWYSGSEEAQANAFAAELLLPEELIKPLCDITNVEFDLIRKISHDFRASLTASATRFVRFCPEPCAIVLSKDNKTKWFHKSESWWPFLNMNTFLDQATVASRFFQKEEVPDEPIEVCGDAWIDSSKCPDYLIEHSIPWPSLGCVLTLLTIDN